MAKSVFLLTFAYPHSHFPDKYNFKNLTKTSKAPIYALGLGRPGFENRCYVIK